MSILNEAVDMAYLKKHTIAFMRKISKDFELEVNLYNYKYAIGAGLNPRLHNVPLGSVLDGMRQIVGMIISIQTSLIVLWWGIMISHSQ